MRIRIELLLPLGAALVVGGVFALAAVGAGGIVRAAMLEEAGPDAAADRVVRTLLVWAALASIAGLLLGLLLARVITRPLDHVRDLARRLAARDPAAAPVSAVAEIDDLARGLERVSEELRERHGREARERAELATLLESVSEGILQLGADGRVVRVNRAARELLGLPADAAGRPASSLFRRPALRRLLEEAVAGGVSGAREVLLDDRRLLVAAAAVPGGGAVATLVDLTELRRLEEIRRDFVANASHELKTPLTSIRGYAETLLTGDTAPADRRQFLETIARNAHRLQHIVDDLLDLSRLESGGWRPEPEPLDLAALATAVWERFQEEAERQDVRFVVEDELREPVVADRRGMDQVLSNLYDNALRYTRGGLIRVYLAEDPGGPGPHAGGARHAAPSRREGWRRVDVVDTGSGIPRDALPRIFERFYRADPARSRAEGGTGLGLSIVKHMVESMGGAVAAESELGRGTTIRIWLPATEGSPAAGEFDDDDRATGAGSG